ncbi:MAG: hypothetical protein OXJ64_15005 [Boseongicola sp.]|nr:hypothetical protein [Boseongicola sp.]
MHEDDRLFEGDCDPRSGRFLQMDAFRRLESGGRNTRYDVWLACV